MTRLLTRPQPIPSWARGLVDDADANLAPLGSLESGSQFVPVPGGGLRTRGGSRILNTLRDDAGTPAELSHIPLLIPYTPVGMIAVGWSNGQNKHYAYRLTADGAFSTGTEATSRHDLTAMATTPWDNASTPARPVGAELYEKMFICDATVTYANRNTFFSIDAAGTLVQPTFAFGAGAATQILPYCLEEYNGVLFIAGYGTEDASDGDRPEYLRHSLLGTSPDSASGFDADAWIILGAKGQRTTGLRKGRGLLLAAKEHELYRISGFGRGNPGWQYVVESVDNTPGVGVSNPHALAFAVANGRAYWYGLGKAGPWRSDGFAVESLVGPRQRGWRGLNQLDTAFVAYHPDRRLVLFGVHPAEAESGRSTTYPWVLWAWDVDRDVWTTDWFVETADLFIVTAVPAGTIAQPAAPPSSPVTASVTASGWTMSFTTGDASAETEWWIKQGAGGTWQLDRVTAAGDVSEAVTGKSGHETYYWKARHRIGPIYTEFTAEETVQTLIPAPTIDDAISTQMGVAGAKLDITLTVTGSGTLTLEVETSPAGAGTWSVVYSAEHAAGQVHVFEGSCGQDVRAICRDAAWTPAASSYSATTATNCSGVP